MQWNSRGTPIFADLTERIAGVDTKRIAFILDGQDLVAPVARAKIPDGSGYIEGSIQDPFTLEEARTLAIQLNSGRLPVPLNLIKESTVDAVLGADSLEASMKAAIVGLSLVVVFMVAYYRVSGLVASGALFIYALITLSIFKMLPVTMTLSGLAGFILSIGMAVDANVLIFERMKEELRTGRSLTSAAEAGFQRAWTSIWDSNVTTFLACAILYWFGTRTGGSLVMGFALTLFIGVAVSMFTAITVSRNLLQLLVMFTPMGKKPGLFTPEPLARATKPAAGGS
jgi:preprotein translocase subunit SecD